MPLRIPKKPSPAVGRRSSSGASENSIELVTALPPSANALYQRRRGGGVALTKTAKKFAISVSTLVSKNLAALSRFPVGPEEVYSVDITLYFEKLENPGWFQTYSRGSNAGERKAKTRYKTVDYDNRIKFLQDSIVKAVGIQNDSQIFNATQRKREDPDNPRAVVTLSVINVVDVLGEHCD